MTLFDQARLGDLLQVAGVRVGKLGRGESWSRPLLLIGEPVACGDGPCKALVCDALTPDGKKVSLHASGSREVRVLERGPVSEFAGQKAEVVAENAKPTVDRWTRADDPDAFAERGDYEDTPNDEGEQH